MKYRKALVLALPIAALLSASAQAATTQTQSVSASSVPANGKTTITVTVTDPTGQYVANPSLGCQSWYIGLSGSGNIVNGASYAGTESTKVTNMTYDPSAPQSNGYGMCRGSYTVASTVAQTETATLYGPGLGGLAANSDTTVNLTFSAYTPPATSPKKAAPAPAAPAPTAPAAPTIAASEVGGTKITDATKPLTLQANQPLVLAGKTVPNGVVTLTIHSTPRTATVTADKDGSWTYTVTGLEAGQHHVEATVTDPTTKLTSAPAVLADFTVAPVKAVQKAVDPVKKKSSLLPMAAYGGVALVVIAAGVLVLIMLKRRHHAVDNSPTTIMPDVPAESANSDADSPTADDEQKSDQEKL